MIKNGIYNFLGGLIRLGLGVATIPILIHIIGIRQYGLYALINAVLAFATLSEWSISTSITVFLARTIKLNQEEYSLDYGSTFKGSAITVVLLSTVTAVILVMIIPLLKYFFKDFTSNEITIITQSCKAGILFIWIRITQQFFIGIEQAHQNYGPINIINTLYNILLSSGTLIIAFVSRDVVNIFLFQSVITSFFSIVHYAYCVNKNLIPIKLFYSKLDYDLLSEMLRYTLKAWIGSLGSILFSQGDRLIVAKLLGSEVVGVYSAMTNIVSQINTLSAMPLQTIIPELSQAHEKIKNSVNNISYSYNLNKILSAFKINILLSLLLGMGVIGFATEILAILSLKDNPQFSLHIMKNSYIFLGIVYTTYSVNALGYYTLLALGETKTFLNIQLISGLISLLTIGFLSYSYGFTGAVIGNTMYLLVFLFTWFTAKKLSIFIFEFIRISFPLFFSFGLFCGLVLLTNPILTLRIIYMILFGGYILWQLRKSVLKYKSFQFFFKIDF